MGIGKQPPSMFAGSTARMDWTEWWRQGEIALRRTALDAPTPRTLGQFARNKPAPRRANCHYLAVDPDPRNVYLY